MMARFIDWERVWDESDRDYPEGCGTIVKRGRVYDYVRWDISGKITKHEADSLGTMGDMHSDVMLYFHLIALGHPWKVVRDWIECPTWQRNCRELRKWATSKNPPKHLKDAIRVPWKPAKAA
jgi:hypothetical protein